MVHLTLMTFQLRAPSLWNFSWLLQGIYRLLGRVPTAVPVGFLFNEAGHHAA